MSRFDHARTHLGRPVYRASSYWVDGLLIDTGPRHARPAFLRHVEGLPVEAVLLTHHHEDHVGNVGPLQVGRELGAYASAEAVQGAQDLGRIPGYRRHTWGQPDVGWVERAPRVVSSRSYAFESVPVPGHTAGDLAWVEPSMGWAFTGDLVLSARQRVTMRQEDLRATIRSLERLLRHEPRVLFTGMRVFEDGTRVLRDRLAFLRQASHDAHALRKTGLTDRQVCRRMLGWEPPLHYWSRGEFGKTHFTRQLLACDPPLV